jgi:hypothetical protein
MTIEQFWNSSWKEFNIYVMAHEREQLTNWQRTRSLAYMMYLSNTGDKTKKSIEQFWHLPGDATSEANSEGYASEEQILATIKNMTNGRGGA